MISLVARAHRELRADMIRAAHRRGDTQISPAHTDVFATLPREGARASYLAARAGITRQSMGELVRELVGLGILEAHPDPDDRRAKIVAFTEHGLEIAGRGRQHIRDLEERFVEEFGAEDCATAKRVLEGMVRLLEESAEEGAE